MVSTSKGRLEGVAAIRANGDLPLLEKLTGFYYYRRPICKSVDVALDQIVMGRLRPTPGPNQPSISDRLDLEERSPAERSLVITKNPSFEELIEESAGYKASLGLSFRDIQKDLGI